MKYNIPALITRMESGEKLKYIFFWGHTRSDKISKSCFSQWYEARFQVDGIEFFTAEHWMMAEKARLFDDQEIYNQIISSDKPGKVKELGRQIIKFDQKVWEQKRFDIVVIGNFHKFSQNPELADFLRNTHDRILVEASPVDEVWGIGLVQDDERASNPLHWRGENLLGFALMEVRDMLLID